MDDYQWIEGIVAVEAILMAQSRDVAEILISQDRFDGRVARLQQLAQALRVAVARVPDSVLNQRAGGDFQGGVIAKVGLRRMQTVDSLFESLRPVIFMLDGVEDPYNFGQAVRSIHAAGIDGLIVPPRNWLSAAATVLRSSAGASEFMPTAVATAVDAASAARLRNVPVAVATAVDALPMHELDLGGPLLLVIGGEKRGVARAVEQAADLRVSIPYDREVQYALGTAAAAAVLSFEILRQRRSRS